MSVPRRIVLAVVVVSIGLVVASMLGGGSSARGDVRSFLRHYQEVRTIAIGDRPDLAPGVVRTTFSREGATLAVETARASASFSTAQGWHAFTGPVESEFIAEELPLGGWPQRLGLGWLFPRGTVSIALRPRVGGGTTAIVEASGGALRP